MFCFLWKSNTFRPLRPSDLFSIFNLYLILCRWKKSHRCTHGLASFAVGSHTKSIILISVYLHPLSTSRLYASALYSTYSKNSHCQVICDKRFCHQTEIHLASTDSCKAFRILSLVSHRCSLFLQGSSLGLIPPLVPLKPP